MDVYKLLTDDIWQSIGVILGFFGIFLGAYYGSKRAYKYTIKKDKEDKLKEVNSYLDAYKEELQSNLQCLNEIRTYINEGPPILTAFDPIVKGSNHLKIDVWNTILRNGLLPYLTQDETKQYSLSTKNLKRTVRVIQIQGSNWIRIIEFRKWDLENKTLQPANLMDVMQRIVSELSESVKYAIDTTEASIAIIESK